MLFLGNNNVDYDMLCIYAKLVRNKLCAKSEPREQRKN